MDLQLQGKTALVTGASMGIGRAIAKMLAAEGVRCAVVARRRALLDQLAAEIGQAGHPAPAVIEADVLPEASPRKIAAEALSALGRIDILVNSAGGSRSLPIDAPEERWTEALTLNFTRLRQLTHAVLPGMMQSQWGRIVNITGKSEPEGLNAAFPSKAAVHAWSKGLSREIGRHGITINCIPPGRIMSEQIRRNYPEDYRREHAQKEIPWAATASPRACRAGGVPRLAPGGLHHRGRDAVDGGLRRYAV